MLRNILLSAMLASSTVVSAQSPASTASSLKFDVASVRENRSNTGDRIGDNPHVNFPIGSDDAFYPTGGVFSATNLPLNSYIIFAYKITNNNRTALMASLPDWAKTESYNIDARTENREVTKDQMREMMRTLLEERFGLRAHHEIRTVPVYAAKLANEGNLGQSLRQHSTGESCHASDSTSEKPIDSGGFPTKCGFANLHTDLRMHRKVGGADLSMATIVSSFSALGNLDKPVVDQTGLVGSYDYTLDYLVEPQPGAEIPEDVVGPTFVEALRTELGLKLAATKAPIDFVIVDHVERPTAN